MTLLFHARFLCELRPVSQVIVCFIICLFASTSPFSHCRLLHVELYILITLYMCVQTSKSLYGYCGLCCWEIYANTFLISFKAFIWDIYIYMIYLFKVYSSVGFIIFTKLCWFQNVFFITRKEIPDPLAVSLCCFLLLPPNHYSAFCLCGLTCSGHFTQTNNTLCSLPWQYSLI